MSDRLGVRSEATLYDKALALCVARMAEASDACNTWRELEAIVCSDATIAVMGQLFMCDFEADVLDALGELSLFTHDD